MPAAQPTGDAPAAALTNSTQIIGTIENLYRTAATFHGKTFPAKNIRTHAKTPSSAIWGQLSLNYGNFFTNVKRELKNAEQSFSEVHQEVGKKRPRGSDPNEDFPAGEFDDDEEADFDEEDDAAMLAEEFDDEEEDDEEEEVDLDYDQDEDEEEDEEGEDDGDNEEEEEEDTSSEVDAATQKQLEAVYGPGRYTKNDAKELLGSQYSDSDQRSSSMSDEDDEEGEGEYDDDEGDIPAAAKTRFQQKLDEDQKLAQDIEDKRALGPDWTMAGESSAKHRPADALIDTDLDFEHGTRAVPVITAASTQSLEERLKKRIKDNNFDDVVRKRPLTTALDLEQKKRDTELDAKKSKQSLVDLYEKEYLEKQKLAEEKAGNTAEHAEALTEIEKDELRVLQMWKRLSQHLDALSNFHYTPKPVVEELDKSTRVRAVQDAAPAISFESKGVFAIDKAAAVAPQDIHRVRHNGSNIVSNSEMSPREKRAVRSAKKAQHKAKEDITAKINMAKAKEKEAAKKRREEAAASKQ